MIIPTIVTHYSLQTGFIKPDEAAAECKRLGYSHCILADSNLTGVIDFFSAMKKEGIMPIVGLRTDDGLYIVKTLSGYRTLLKIASGQNEKYNSEDLELFDDGDLSVFTVYYSKQEDAILHRIMVAAKHKANFKKIKDGTKDIGEDKLFFNTDEFYFKDVSPKLFTDLQLNRTKELVESIESFDIFSKPKLPHIDTGDLSEAEKIVQLCRAGYKAKLSHLKGDEKKLYGERAKYELEIITKFGLSSYFLIVTDIVDYIRSNGWLTPYGRGCFLPHSRVKMSDGMYCPISVVNVGDSVIDAYGNPQIVENVLEYTVDEELVELTMENGKVICCTKDHEILTYNRGWIEAQYIDEHDEIVEV